MQFKSSTKSKVSSMFRLLLNLFLITILFPIDNYSYQAYRPQREDPLNEILFWTRFKEMDNYEFECMTEDEKGTLWFGGRGTVARYDGDNWSFFFLSGPHREERVLSLCSDGNETVYCGLESGLWVLKKGVWEKVFPKQNDWKVYISEVRKFSDGSIWAASDKGLIVIKDSKTFLYTIPGIGLKKQNIMPEVKILYFSGEFPLGFNVVSVCEGNNDEVWFALESKEILRVKRSNPTKAINIWRNLDKGKGIEKEMPQRLLLADDGKIWSVTSQANRGINIFDPKKNKWTRFYLSELFGGDDTNEDIIQTKDGKIWIGGIRRLFTYFEGQWREYTSYQTPLPAARIQLLESRDGSVWIGGKHNTLYRLDYSRNRWEILKHLNFHTESLDGKRWFISVDKRVVMNDTATENWVSYGTEDGLIDNPLVLITTSKGQVWAAGSHHSVAATAFFDGHRWQKQIYPQLGMSIHYRNIFEAADGTLWIGAFDTIIRKPYLGGVLNIRLNTNNEITKKHFTYSDIGRNDVMGITQDKEGTIWTAGIFVEKYDGKTWTKITQPADLASGWLDEIKCDRKGGIWAADEGVGLFYLPEKGKKWRKFTINDGLASNTILSILPLMDGTVLVGTEKGISRFDGNSWLTYALPKSITIQRDGGMLNQTEDGSIWVNNSSASWNRSALGPLTSKEWTYVRKVFRTIHYIPENIPPKTKIIIAPKQVSEKGNLFIKWAGSDYLNETPADLLQYSFRLNNGPWSNFSYDTQKLFLALGRGAYSFEIRARDMDMNVEKAIKRHIFVVAPPLWLRPWFITLVLSFIIIVTILVYYIYRKQLLINKMEAEKIHEMDMMKLRFYTNLSHDLRTPLNLILSPLSDLLEKAKENRRLKQQYELMYRNAVRLNNLVDEIIDFRKIETGSMEYTPSSAYIKRFIENIVDSFKLLALKQKITFKLIADFEDCYVLFDSEKLETILYNLLSNAFKYTPGHGQITLYLNLKDGNDKELLEIKVEDSGPGIPEDKISTIFERYVQLKINKYSNEQGAGIGLALTKELVEICDGKIFAENKKTGGAVFTVLLPLRIIRLEEEIKRKETIAHELEQLKQTNEVGIMEDKMRQLILVVEDYDDEREYITNKLLEEFDVISARNGKEGVEKAKEIIPDLIISDIKMPEMDGFELCKMLRDDAVTSHIPFIFLSGKQSEEARLEGFRIGADDFVSKPFKYSLLLARVKNIFERRQKMLERFNKDLEISQEYLSSKEGEFLKKAKEIVDKYMSDESFDVLVLCNEIGMSRTQLFRKFKALTGDTPNSFIRRIRLQKAAVLLKKSDMNVTEICYEVGYKYPGHFSQHFKKQFGCTPKDFQKIDN